MEHGGSVVTSVPTTGVWLSDSSCKQRSGLQMSVLPMEAEQLWREESYTDTTETVQHRAYLDELGGCVECVLVLDHTAWKESIRVCGED